MLIEREEFFGRQSNLLVFNRFQNRTEDVEEINENKKYFFISILLRECFDAQKKIVSNSFKAIV